MEHILGLIAVVVYLISYKSNEVIHPSTVIICFAIYAGLATFWKIGRKLISD